MDENTLIPILNKHSLNKTEIIDIANQIINNIMIIKYKYVPQNFEEIDEQLKYDNESFSWITTFDDSNNMAMLHLHSLEPISYLLIAYHHTEKDDYLYKAYEILLDWYEHSIDANHFYLWYRHCVADRAVVISQMYFWKDEIFITTEDLNKLFKLIFNHKEYLLKDENYIKHNHGTLMDIGLLALAMSSGDKVVVEFSTIRLKNNFFDTFTDDMVCVENSLSYSIYNLEQFIKSQKYLMEPLNRTIADDFDSKIGKALDFFDIIKQPDDGFPNLGDGENFDVEYLKSLSLFDFYKEHSLFEKRKETLSKVYYDIGYVVIKSDDSYVFINGGDIKKNHKHADDLSFTLYYDEEILIDPGIYSYENNPIREYQVSAQAHNTIVLNNENYKYITNGNDDVKIHLFEEFDTYYYVIAKNKSYEFAEIFRHFYVLKNDFTIIIYDEIFSNNKILASQYFNLSPNQYKGKKIDFLDSEIKINNKFKIKYDQESFCELYNGRNPFNINAIYSNKFHDYKPTAKIGINKYGKSPKLTTIISKSMDTKIEVNEEYIHSGVINIKLDDNMISLKKEKINTNTFEKLPILEMEKKGNKVYFITKAEYFEHQEYAWDIMKGKEKEKVIWYQEKSSFNYIFEESGDYSIRCYIRNKYNPDEKKSFKNNQKIKI